MPSTSPKQHRFMEMVAHDPAAARDAGVPQSVGEEFVEADKEKKKKKEGGGVAKRIMRRFAISEISAVDRPAQSHAKAVLMKREFSASERKEDAKSGAAEPDGSFPITNATDLHNAMRAVGRSKNPAKTKAHIRARAKALGLTSELSDAFKRETMFGKIAAAIFGQRVERANAALAKSIESIVADDKAEDKAALVETTLKQFGDHLIEGLPGDFDKAMAAGSAVEQAGDPGANDRGDTMSEAVKKALGLSAEASEEDVLKAIEKAKDGKKKDGKDGRDGEDGKDGKDGEDGLDGKDGMKKALDALPAEIRKQLADAEDMRKRLVTLEEQSTVAKFEKAAADSGVAGLSGGILRKAYSGDTSAVDAIVKMAATAQAALEHSGVFKELGTAKGAAGDAYDQLMAKADELRKRDPQLTPAQAFSKVYSDPANSALAKAERRENRPVAF